MHQGGWGHPEPFSRGFRGWIPLRNFLGPNRYLDWHKKDLNVTKTSTA